MSVVHAPRARRGQAWKIALGACGGCALLGVLGFAVAAYFGMKAVKGTIAGVQQQQTTMAAFLGDLKAGNYSDAHRRLSPEGQTTLTATKLKAQVEGVKKKLGKLESWTGVDPQGKRIDNSDMHSDGQGMVTRYRIPVTFQKGSGTATFVFRGKSALDFASAPTEFKLETEAGGGGE